MKKALVTGGAGFLGNAVVRAIQQRGVKVRVLALPDEALDNLEGTEEVEVIRGNVMSPEDCVRAVKGMDTVFHCAAIYKDYMADPTPMYEVNLRGTFNMLEASRRAKVERVIYTASVAALGRPAPGTIADEQSHYEAWDINFHYSRSKYHSMLTALDFANWGLDVRVVCPGLIFGPGDIAPTPSGNLILSIMKGKAPAYTKGGFSYVDVRDAAEVHARVAERGRKGEAYIATGHNLDNDAFMAAVARSSDRSIPRARKIPAPVALALVSGMTYAKVKAGQTPDMTRPFLEYGLQPGYFSNDKARQQLEAQFRPIEDTIRDAIHYFRGRGLLSA